MTRAVAKKPTTTKKEVVADDEVERFAAAMSAKQQFLGSTLNMGWRLAVTVVVPIVLGVKLDERLNSSPSWTLAGLFLAAFAGSAAVWSTVKEVNKEQAEAALPKNKKAKSEDKK